MQHFWPVFGTLFLFSIYFSFGFFLCLNIFSHFSGGEKVKSFVFFSYKWKLRNVFELNFDMQSWSVLIKLFLDLFIDYCHNWKQFLWFWDSCSCFGPIWKKKKENLKNNFQKCWTFEISFVSLGPKFQPISRKFNQ